MVKRRMTWSEFKAAVEAGGVTDNDRMSYIDIHGDNCVSIERGAEPHEPGKTWFMISGGYLEQPDDGDE